MAKPVYSDQDSESDVKIDVKVPEVNEWDGSATTLTKFLTDLNSYFLMRRKSYPPRKSNKARIIYASMRLKGHASKWWESIKDKKWGSFEGFESEIPIHFRDARCQR